MKSDQRKEINELVKILKEQNLSEIEIERKDLRIRIRQDQVMVSTGSGGSRAQPVSRNVAPQISAETSDNDVSKLFTVTSPIVGIFYRSSSPDADPYVEEGDLVQKGQVLCIVEAMKLMNEIESETDGRIAKIFVESAVSVEYGQPLFLIEPISPESILPRK